jgi:DNA adenine methylase
MVNYSCIECGKSFNQKSHYVAHINKKTPCKKEEKFEKIIDEKLEKIINERLEKIIDEKIEKILNEKFNEKFNKKLNEILNENSNEKLKPMIKWKVRKDVDINSIIEHIPKKYSTYIEPFVGDGRLYFHLNSKSSIISDESKEILDFYQIVKMGYSNNIYNFMKEQENEKEWYLEKRKEYNELKEIKNEIDLLEKVKLFYYLRKTCFRGVVRYNNKGEFNIPFGNYKKYSFEEIKIKSNEDLLRKTEIIYNDYKYLFEKYNEEDNFMYINPLNNNFEKKDNKMIKELMEETKIKCLLVIENTEYNKKLYENMKIEVYKKENSKNIEEEKNENLKEYLIIKNY